MTQLISLRRYSPACPRYMAGKGYDAIRNDIAALHRTLDRRSHNIGRETRQKFRAKVEEDLKTVTSETRSSSTADGLGKSFAIDNYFSQLELASIPEQAPQILAM